MNKKGSRLTPKSENGVDSLSLRSASDGDALSERSLPSSPSPRANRYRFRKRVRCRTKQGHQIRSRIAAIHRSETRLEWERISF